MPRPGGVGTTITFGDIQVSSDAASLSDVLQTLSTIIERHGYPNPDGEHRQKEKDVQVEAEVEAKKLLAEYEASIKEAQDPRSSTPWRKT